MMNVDIMAAMAIARLARQTGERVERVISDRVFFWVARVFFLGGMKITITILNIEMFGGCFSRWLSI